MHTFRLQRRVVQIQTCLSESTVENPQDSIVLNSHPDLLCDLGQLLLPLFSSVFSSVKS